MKHLTPLIILTVLLITTPFSNASNIESQIKSRANKAEKNIVVLEELSENVPQAKAKLLSLFLMMEKSYSSVTNKVRNRDFYSFTMIIKNPHPENDVKEYIIMPVVTTDKTDFMYTISGTSKIPKFVNFVATQWLFMIHYEKMKGVIRFDYNDPFKYTIEYVDQVYNIEDFIKYLR